MKSKPSTRGFWFLTVLAGAFLASVLFQLSRFEPKKSKHLSVQVTALARSCIQPPEEVGNIGSKVKGEPEVSDSNTLTGEAAKAALQRSGQFESFVTALTAAQHAFEKIDRSTPSSRGADYFASNPGQQLRAWFSNVGVELASGLPTPKSEEPWNLSLRLHGIGRGRAITPVSTGISSNQGNRLETRHPEGAIIQWFENRQEGLEQGFTIQRQPDAGSGDLRLILEVEGNLRVNNEESQDGVRFSNAKGIEILHYKDLRAWDADGKILPARTEVRSQNFIILVVEDEGARYPLTVDPLFASLEARLRQDLAGVGAFGSSVAISGNSLIDFTSTTAWKSVPIGYKNESFVINFELTPLAFSMDAVTGLAFGEADWYSDLACTLRLNPGGYFDAINGIGYEKINLLNYVPGHEYEVVMTVHPRSNRYSVTVDGTIIAEDYQFRDEQAFQLTLDSLVIKNETGAHTVRFSVDNTALIGAAGTDTPKGVDVGAAFVMTRKENLWTLQNRLEASDAESDDYFGVSVSLRENTALVGASKAFDSQTSGSAYVFERNGQGWNQHAKLAIAGSAANGFGASVALAEDTALVGAPQSGKAYFFSKSGGLWQFQSMFAGSGTSYDDFGRSVAISGNTAVVSSQAFGGYLDGYAIVFERNSNSWTLQEFLTGDVSNEGEFGASVAISGNTVLVGAPGDELEGFADCGAAYVFENDGNSWQSRVKLYASDRFHGDGFGTAVAIDGNTALIGTPYDDGSTENEGSAYLFQRTGNVWNQQAKLTAGIDSSIGHVFGISLAICPDTALVGNGGSSAHFFNIGEFPVITKQPDSRVVLAGKPVSFNIVAVGSGPLLYQWRKDGNLIVGETGTTYTIPSAQSVNEADYDCIVSNVGGVVTSAPATLRINNLSSLEKGNIDEEDPSWGFFVVNLIPTGVGGWRFVGEQGWRASGIPVGGLTTSDRVVEFMPVSGYIQPSPEPASIISGGVATFLSASYFATGETGSGGVGVVLKPDSLANEVVEAGRAQWRLYKLGTNTDPWLDSGASLAGLLPGSYVVECKPVSGRTTPPLANVVVDDGDASLVTITYFLQDAQTGAAPAVLPFETLSNSPSLPYAYVGQIRGDAGSSSGFVVKPRVVVTAGHVVFDDGTLSLVTGLQWLFQRDSISHEPVPLIPRGIHLLDDYAAARSAPGVIPGVGTTESQNRDGAAMFFAEDAGRGGFGGFLASDATDNEFLLSPSQKMLVGYPVDGVSPTNQGRMHATPAMNVGLTRVPTLDEFGNPFRTYTTPDIRGKGGMSGGPMCVQFEGGSYYPAAIYLGGSNQTVVRAIDSKVIDVITRAEASAASGDNNTGGGYTLSSFSTISGGSAQSGAVKVIIKPAAARNAGALWRLNNRDFHDSGVTETIPSSGAPYTLYLTNVPGFEPPDPAGKSLVFKGGKIQEITYTYVDENDAPTIANVGNKTTNEDTPAASIAVTIDDVDDANNSLEMTGSSSNTGLVPNANIVFGGSGANRTVVITPAANQNGSTTITLTVSDGKLTDSDSFLLTVNPVNDAPTITTITDRNLAVNSSTGAIAFTVGDIDTTVGSLTLIKASSNTSLVPSGNIAFGGSGASRTVTVTPVTGQLGSTAITVTVSDGALTASRTFTVTVTGGARETWRFANFGTVTNTGASSDNADPDGDGNTNQDEYAAGTDPNSSADVFKVLAITRTAGACTLSASGKAARSYILEHRANLTTGPWTPVNSVGPLPVNGPVTLTDSSPPASTGFYRIRVSFP